MNDYETCIVVQKNLDGSINVHIIGPCNVDKNVIARVYELILQTLMQHK